MASMALAMSGRVATTAAAALRSSSLMRRSMSRVGSSSMCSVSGLRASVRRLARLGLVCMWYEFLLHPLDRSSSRDCESGLRLQCNLCFSASPSQYPLPVHALPEHDNPPKYSGEDSDVDRTKHTLSIVRGGVRKVQNAGAQP